MSNETLANTVVRNIRAYAAVKGTNCTAVANALGVSQQGLRRKWVGETPWKTEDIDAVASVLKVSPYALCQPNNLTTDANDDFFLTDNFDMLLKEIHDCLIKQSWRVHGQTAEEYFQTRFNPTNSYLSPDGLKRLAERVVVSEAQVPAAVLATVVGKSPRQVQRAVAAAREAERLKRMAIFNKEKLPLMDSNHQPAG